MNCSTAYQYWEAYVKVQNNALIFYLTVTLGTNDAQNHLDFQFCKREDLTNETGCLVLEVIGWTNNEISGSHPLTLTFGEILKNCIYERVILVDEFEQEIAAFAFCTAEVTVSCDADSASEYLVSGQIGAADDAPNYRLLAYPGQQVLDGQLLLRCIEGEPSKRRQTGKVRFKHKHSATLPPLQAVVITDISGRILFAQRLKSEVRVSRWGKYVHDWLRQLEQRG
ncbi:hypothetical protein [Pedobacter sp. SYP-B3415]|uniref:hypothetical protein n=1 Tax=Pedobacter sp. SYP-B3415 TaxID=2496641 RepID=UPI00101C4935|nr:hypothetical protein [Pedobacter sp. SYP-B3415]